MADRKPRNWLLVAALHLVAAIALAFAGAVLTGVALKAAYTAAVQGALVAVLVAAVLLGLLWLVTRRARSVHKGVWGVVGKVLKARPFFVLALAWLGLGFAEIGIAEVVALPTGRRPGPSIFASAVAGPFVFQSIKGNTSAVLLVGAVWVCVWIWLAHELGLARKGGKHFTDRFAETGLGGLVKRAFGQAKKAPDEEPEGAYWAQVDEDVPGQIAEPDKLDDEALIGEAKLAKDWGGWKRPVPVRLDNDDSMVVFGGPGSAKTAGFLIRVLLNYVGVPGALPTKFIVTSTKPADILFVVARWLLARRVRLETWDLTRTIPDDAQDVGSLVRWSPVVGIRSFDDAKKVAKRIVEAARDDETKTRDRFWNEQVVAILAPALLVAASTGKDYEDALVWATKWNDPSDLDVQLALEARNETAALNSWVQVRQTILSQNQSDPHVWTSLSTASGQTGQSINATLNGLMQALNTKAAHAATRTPNFDPAGWLEADGPAALFLIGDQLEEQMTRALLVPLVRELLDGAMRMARADGGRLARFKLVALLDEVGNLAPIPRLGTDLATGRAHGIRVVCFFQSRGQLETNYGPETARTICDAARSILVLSGIVDERTTSWLTHIGGMEFVTQESETTSDNLKSSTTSKTQRPLIDGHAVTGLRGPRGRKPGEGILIVAGVKKLKVTLPLWAFDSRLSHRGVPMPEHEEVHGKFAEELQGKPGVLLRRVVRQFARTKTAQRLGFSAQLDAVGSVPDFASDAAAPFHATVVHAPTRPVSSPAWSQHAGVLVVIPTPEQAAASPPMTPAPTPEPAPAPAPVSSEPAAPAAPPAPPATTKVAAKASTRSKKAGGGQLPGQLTIADMLPVTGPPAPTTSLDLKPFGGDKRAATLAATLRRELFRKATPAQKWRLAQIRDAGPFLEAKEAGTLKALLGPADYTAAELKAFAAAAKAEPAANPAPAERPSKAKTTPTPAATPTPAVPLRPVIDGGVQPARPAQPAMQQRPSLSSLVRINQPLSPGIPVSFMIPNLEVTRLAFLGAQDVLSQVKIDRELARMAIVDLNGVSWSLDVEGHIRWKRAGEDWHLSELHIWEEPELDDIPWKEATYRNYR